MTFESRIIRQRITQEYLQHFLDNPARNVDSILEEALEQFENTYNAVADYSSTRHGYLIEIIPGRGAERSAIRSGVSTIYYYLENN